MDHRGFFQRFSPWILVALVAALPFAFFGALRAVQSNTNQVEDWLPADFPETQDLKWFRQHFAADQFIIISWPECRLGPPGGDGNGGNGDDPRIEAFAQALMEEKNEKGESPYFKTVTTGRRFSINWFLLHRMSLTRKPSGGSKVRSWVPMASRPV